MTTTNLHPSPPGTTTSGVPRLLGFAGLWSGLAALLGLWWWLTASYPFGPADPRGEDTPLGALPAAAGPPLLVAAGLLGVLLAVLARTRPGRAGTGLLIGAGVVHGAVFLLLVPGVSLLVLAGYLMAAFGPLVLLGVLVAGARRSWAARVAVAVLVLVAALAWVTGFADPTIVSGYAGAFAGGLADQALRMLTLIFLAAGGVLWIAVAVRAVFADRFAPDWARPERAARWGLVATLIATLCTLPYGLIRLTWLTPWPLFLPAGTDLSTVPEMRLQGLLLGTAALAGALLTIGLVARWGEVWPRWMPVLRGRPVPVAAAVVPATLVATVVCSAAVPMAMMGINSGMLEFLFIFPLPVWGPALGAAALAYALRRRGELSRPGTIEGS